MALQMSVTLRNARLDQIETTITTGAHLCIYSGTKPTDCATALSGNTKLADITLPADWMAAAAAGSKAIAGGPWQDASADAAGTASFFRIYTPNDIGTCHLQGTITATGGGGDLQLDNVSIASGQQVSITAFTLNEGNA